MKKTLSLILLSSALFLPNHSVEASTINQAQPQKQTYTWNVQKQDVRSYYYGRYYFGYQKPVRPTQPAPQPTKPTTPAPTPEQPSKPVENPSTPEKPTTEKQQTSNVSAIEQAVLDLTNAERAKAGLKPLQIDAALQKSAKQKSADMAMNRYFSHTSPTYGSPFDQMKSNGVTYRQAAENIAMGQRSAQEVVTAWMNSAGHRQNILTPGFTHIGIGYDANGHYWTQQFIQK
ncbi:CAP domain-containing protein [Sporosarcina sp. GW1-11]|uniref:CAP domain-containing protein n=1 Tax=Sporosarcina sp. GW1-11 TaxID=2899126 RepID=UPI00294F2FD6|nr:CAP domain-containing protein [Sporosarcina sp. GW1-11]MDV6377116.1 CAP domain-containing protein [Sporosarcina sp. GW1-11]